jgi:hypothetical protein
MADSGDAKRKTNPIKIAHASESGAPASLRASRSNRVFICLWRRFNTAIAASQHRAPRIQRIPKTSGDGFDLDQVGNCINSQPE